MAWKRADDLTGATDDVEQVTFGLDGKAYLIDLGSQNHERLRDLLEEFIGVSLQYGDLPEPPAREVPPAEPTPPPVAKSRTGTKTGRRGTGPVVLTTPQGATVTRTTRRQRRTRTGQTPGTAPAKASPTQTIRGWAREHGFEVSDSGRIRAEVLSAYKAAH